MNLGHQLGARLGASVRDTVNKPRGAQPPPPPPNKPITWVAHELGQWTSRWVREVIAVHDPVFYEVWITAHDERTCPACGQLNGQVWQQGQGYHPPVHDNCRCARVYHHTEFRARYIERWREEHYFSSNIQWRRTP